MGKAKVVLISGKQGSGKTTLSKRLIQKLHSRPSSRAIVLKFADPLYRMHDFCTGILKNAGIVRDIVKDGPLLQMLGTEWGRKTVDENIWVKIAVAEVERQNKSLANTFQNLTIIIDDCRFKNELMGIPDALRVRLECHRDTRKVRCEAWRDNEMHPSEIDLDDWALMPGKFDLIFNTATQDSDHCATMIAAQLDKGIWMEKR